MTTFSQQTPLQRAKDHIGMITKTSALLRRNPTLRLDAPDDAAWEPSADTAEARRKAINNCEAAADDYDKNGHPEMAELYRLKAHSIGGSASATRDYFRKLEEVREGRTTSESKSSGRISGGERLTHLFIGFPIFAFVGLAIGLVGEGLKKGSGIGQAAGWVLFFLGIAALFWGAKLALTGLTGQK